MIQKTLIVLGLLLIVLGGAWPWLGKFPFGRLPGDIVISRPGFTFYFPITTMILVSLLLSFLAWLLKK